MNNSTHLNYLALNQNILGKPLIFGSGPQEGDAIDPIISYEGLKIYLNGTYNLSEFIDEDFELTELIRFGEMIHPDAMMGMPGSSGELKYELGITDKYYVIIVRLKLDEEVNGESEEASDLLALIDKSEIPSTFDYGEDTNYVIAKEMLLAHFNKLFEFYDTYEQLLDSGFEINKELALNEIIKYHFDLKQSVRDIEKELSK
jgi:hypothetical protein